MARPKRWNEIVDAATTLFRQEGSTASIAGDIAGEVGMYKGSLYHYIKSKEDLLTAVVHEPADQILADVRLTAQDVSSSEKVRLLIRSLLSMLEGNFARCAVYIDKVAGRHRSDEWAAMDREPARTVVGIVEDEPEAWRVLPSARPAHHDARPDRLAALAHPVVPARR